MTRGYHLEISYIENWFLSPFLIRLNHRTFSGTHIGVQYTMHSPLNITCFFHSFLRLSETFKLVQLWSLMSSTIHYEINWYQNQRNLSIVKSICFRLRPILCFFRSQNSLWKPSLSGYVPRLDGEKIQLVRWLKSSFSKFIVLMLKSMKVQFFHGYNAQILEILGNLG